MQAFLEREIVFSPTFARSEVERYTFRSPGQATAYFYGYTKFVALREEVEALLGDAFEPCAFHDFVLDQGLVPPDALRSALIYSRIGRHNAWAMLASAAALLLGRDKSQVTLDALKDALLDMDWSVRAAAVHSLALRDDPALKQDLEPLLDDGKEAVRLRAAAGVLRLSAIEEEAAKKKQPKQTKRK